MIDALFGKRKGRDLPGGWLVMGMLYNSRTRASGVNQPRCPPASAPERRSARTSVPDG